MTKITLKYNPFEAKAVYEYKGKTKPMPKCMGEGENSRLQDWLYDFFPQLKEMHNWGEGSECAVSFYGTPGDFEDLEHARDVFQKDKANQGIQINLTHSNSSTETLGKRLSKLKELFERMHNESPYPELRTPKLKEDFDQAVSSEFEISVIATMSSGKSTLINAILGQEILPARNEATTAKIAQIHDSDGEKGWTVRGLKKDENGNYIPATEKKNATLEELEELNKDNNGIDKIEIFGKIPGINSREMRLLLSDTPGPNNSRSSDHAKHIDDLIKEAYKPMIMYILNATQLEINDDKSLLEKIAKAMEGNGKQASDRFLFVLNKADQLDPEKNEFVEKKVADSKDYLKNQFGITGARIFPVSAQLAKLIRMSQAGRSMTGDEEDFLDTRKKRFISRSERHLSDYVSLSPSCRQMQEEKLQNACAVNDENTQALVYSGLHAIELAINEYLEKYALTAKISKAVSLFKTIADNLHLKNKTQKELAQNKNEREKVLKELGALKKSMESGEAAKKLKNKVDDDIVSIKQKLKDGFKEHETAVRALAANESGKYASDDVSPAKAKEIVNGTQKKMREEYEIFSADLSRLFDSELKKQAQGYIKAYRKYVEDLVGETAGVDVTALKLIQVDIPGDADDLLDRFTEIKVHRHSSGNPDKRWYKPWTWFDEEYRAWTTEETLIKMSGVFNNEIEPLFMQFISMINDARKIADNNAKDLKDFFTSEIGRLDNALKEAVERQEAFLKDQKTLEENIKANQAKIDWLDEFIEKLEKVLEV